MFEKIKRFGIPEAKPAAERFPLEDSRYDLDGSAELRRGMVSVDIYVSNHTVYARHIE